MSKSAEQRARRKLERAQAERVTGIPAAEEDTAIVDALAGRFNKRKSHAT